MFKSSMKTRAIIVVSSFGAVVFSVLSYIRPLTYWMYGMAGGYYGFPDVVPGFLPPKTSIHRGVWGRTFTPTRRIRLPKLSG